MKTDRRSGIQRDIKIQRHIETYRQTFRDTERHRDREI